MRSIIIFFICLTTKKWTDRRLDWSSDRNYSDDISYIFSNQQHVWRPYLLLENS